MGSSKSTGGFYRASVTHVLINNNALLVSTVAVGNETSLVKSSLTSMIRVRYRLLLVK